MTLDRQPIVRAGGRQAVRCMERCGPAAILKDVGNFSVDIFAGRLALQKAVRILQAFGADLGCRFAWYLHGPYCKSLFRGGPESRKFIDRLPKTGVRLECGWTQRRYEQFKEFMADKKHGPALLEICASICRLAAAGIGKNCTVEGEKPELARGQLVSMWGEPDARGGRQ